MNAKTYATTIIEAFAAQADPAQAEPMAQYMRNKFPFFGIKSPARRALQANLWRQLGKPSIDLLPEIVAQLYAAPQRELQYAALDLLQKMRSKMTPAYIPVLEDLVKQKSWWDTVDMIASNGLGYLLQKFPEFKMPRSTAWIESNNIWWQRTAIIFQLRYGQQTDWELLQAHILYRIESEEFFIQKAAGWALRQYAKYNPTAVLEFVETYAEQISPLTRREALKHLN